MHNHTQFIKKFVGSFLGVAGVSTLIVFPGIVQANNNSGPSSSSNKLIFAQSTPTTESPSGSTNRNGSQVNIEQQFVTQAAQSDQTEIQTGKLALQRSSNKTVRSYAERMIKEHTQSTQQLTKIAKQKRYKLPTNIGEENSALVTQLTNLKGANFDQAYMQGQAEAHSKTLTNFQNYLQQGKDTQLRAFADKLVPIITDHLQMAQSMAQGSGMDGMGGMGTSTPSTGTSNTQTPVPGQGR